MSVEPLQRRTFLEQIVRWLAIIGCGYGGLGLVSVVITFVANGGWVARWSSWQGGTIGSRLVTIEVMTRLLYSGLSILLLLSSRAVYRWQHWGRSGMMIWAIATIVVGFLACVMNVLWYLDYRRSTPQPIAPGAAFIAWSFLASFLERCAFPAITLAILLQGSVRDAFRPPVRGGFEVVPLAARADVAQPASDPQR